MADKQEIRAKDKYTICKTESFVSTPLIDAILALCASVDWRPMPMKKIRTEIVKIIASILGIF